MGISVLGASDPGTFLVLPQTLLLRGYEHVHEYQIINENKIGWYLKVSFSKTAVEEVSARDPKKWFRSHAETLAKNN